MYDPGVMYGIASFMVAKTRDVNAIKTFTQFLKQCITSNQLGDPLVKQWRAAVNEYVVRISSLRKQDLLQTEWRELGDVLCTLEQNRYHEVLDCAGQCFYYAEEYGHAVKYWEKCGVTKKREYHLAKAEVSGFPDGLESLQQAEDYERIIAEWKMAGGLEKATGREWLKFVGPALEMEGQHWAAIPVYMQLGDSGKVLGCFAKGSKKVATLEFWEGLVHLVKYLVNRDRWTDAFHAIDEYEAAGSNAVRIKLRCYVVREFADSGVTYESIQRDLRRACDKFINRALQGNDWQRYLSLQEAGAALERTGSFNSIDEFYSRFLGNSKLKQFARERWMLNKRRQEDYFRSEGEKEKAEHIRIELSNRGYEWGIRLDRLNDLPHYPTVKPQKERKFADNEKGSQ